MFVITDDLIGSAPIEIGQRGATPADFQYFSGKAPSGVLTPNALQSLFGGPAYRCRHCFMSGGSKLANGFLGRRILDAKGHRHTSGKNQ